MYENKKPIYAMSSRKTITKKEVQNFMKAVGKTLKKRATLYLTGGTTAILYGFRDGTIDIDIAGDIDELFSHIPTLKERLQINIEMAKPTDFVPSLPGEKNRHIKIHTIGKVTFMHFDPYSQALSKIVRAHTTDIADVKSLISESLVDMKELRKMVRQLSDRDFAKYPRLTRSAVQSAVESFSM